MLGVETHCYVCSSAYPHDRSQRATPLQTIWSGVLGDRHSPRILSLSPLSAIIPLVVPIAVVPIAVVPIAVVPIAVVPIAVVPIAVAFEQTHHESK
jgi:hypothetical protein